MLIFFFCVLILQKTPLLLSGVFLFRILHGFRNGNLEHCKNVVDCGFGCGAKSDSCVHSVLIFTAAAACVIEFVEHGRKVDGVLGNS